jgi:phosphohistidine phosphatase
MRIYLTQHGLAVPKEVDPERPLSEQGRGDVRRLADFLGGAGVRVEQVVHSGKARAEQTASLLAEAVLPALLTAGRAQARAGLSPNDPVEPLATALQAWSADTLLVGHLPFLGRLASLLLASDPERPTPAFQPGSMACLERDTAGQWVLLWMLRPELLGTDRD